MQKAFSGPEWDLSTKENCHWKEMKIAQRQINFHKNVVRAIQS